MSECRGVTCGASRDFCWSYRPFMHSDTTIYVWMRDELYKRLSTEMSELGCWRRLFRDPWAARQSNQSLLKEINSEYPLEGLMLNLKLQYFGHLMWRSDSLEKTLMLGKIEGRSRRRRQMMRWLNNITNSMDMLLSKFQQIVKEREAWHAAVHGVQRVRYQWETEQWKYCFEYLSSKLIY